MDGSHNAGYEPRATTDRASKNISFFSGYAENPNLFKDPPTQVTSKEEPAWPPKRSALRLCRST